MSRVLEIKEDIVSSLMIFADDCLNDGSDKEAVNAAFKTLCEVNSIDQFVESIRVFADETEVLNVEHYADKSRQMTRRDCSNKIKGDLFEIFTKIYFNEFHEGVFDVQFAPHDQKGWDFEGTNNIGNKCLIQSKFVSRGEFDGDLATFYGEGFFSEGVVNAGDGSVSGVLFTSAERVSRKIKNYTYDHDAFKIIDRKALKKKDFPGFWKTVNRVFKEELFVACDFE